MASPDPALCPLCGESNRCELAAAKPGEAPAAPCWCQDRSFRRELLEQVPEQTRQRACICQRCLEKSAHTGAGEGRGARGDPEPASGDPPAGGRQPRPGNRQA